MSKITNFRPSVNAYGYPELLSQNQEKEFNIDQREEKILNFLENLAIEIKNPLEKYYDYCDGERRKNSMETSNSEKSNYEEEKPIRTNSCIILNSALYKKRKCKKMVTEGGVEPSV